MEDKGDAYCFFSDQEGGVVHHKYTPQGQTANHKFYLEVLRCLRDAICHT